MSGDWLRQYRSELDSEVFNCGCDFIYRLWNWCKMKCNWKPSYFKGRKIESGQFATGRNSASGELNVSPSKWFRGMKKLESMGNINIENVNNRFSLVTVVNWPKYQGSGSPANNQRTTDDATGDRTSEQLMTQPVTGPVNTIEEGKKGRREELKEGGRAPQQILDGPVGFIPPTGAEAQAYADMHSSLKPGWPKEPFDAEVFCDYYASNGWRQGNGVPIVDWKAAIRSWGRRSFGGKRNQNTDGLSVGERSMQEKL